MVVFWDWNGTLCDDVYVALEAVNDMLRLRGRAPITLQQYYAYMDTPIRLFYERLFGRTDLPMGEISAHFHAYYRTHLRRDCLAKGAREALQALQNAQVRQFLLSSGHRESILPHVTRLGLLPYFEEVLAADDWDAVSKEERARLCMERNGLRGDDVWFVGDLLHDFDVARQLGAHCLLYAGGHQGEETLKSAGVPVLDDLQDVISQLGNFRGND